MKNNWFKKKSLYIPTIAVVMVILILIYRSNRRAPLASVVSVKQESLTQEVTVSGTVKAKEAVELAFEKSGRIRKINADVGERVEQEETLLSLENGVELSAVEDAKAKLASKQAHYDDLKKGGRPEEINLKDTELAKAKSDLATDYAAVPNIIFDAFNKTDNAVHRQADILFSNTMSNNPQLNFYSGDQQASLDAQTNRFTVEGIINNFKKLAQGAPLSDTDSENALAQAKNYLLSVNDFLIKTNRTLNAALNLSDSALATDKDALNTARTNINTALTNVTAQIQTISTQKINIRTAQSQLELTKAPASPEVLAGALADVASADANVKNAEALLLKTYILSPLSGIVTKQEAKVGEIAGANQTLVSVMSGNFKVEAFVPEVDVAKMALGNKADITLDAYGSDISFGAHVVKIDPAETIIGGVSTYKTTLEFDKDDNRIRSGLTANTTIISAEREGVLAIPQRAVYEKGGKKFVRITKDATASEEREVTVGIRGSNGDVEILSGLREGESVGASGKK